VLTDASGGSHKPEVNATFIQPFLSYTWKDSTTLTLNSESTRLERGPLERAH
jgi:hypothetical protein